MHISCTICIELVDPQKALQSTKCGHLFHHHCLTDWIRRSSTCPQCRNQLTLNCIMQIYPTFSDEDCPPIATLQASMVEKCTEISTLKSSIDEKRSEISTLKSNLDEKCVEIRSLESFVEDKSLEIATLQSKLDEKNSEITNMQVNLDEAFQELSKLREKCEAKEVGLQQAGEDLKKNEDSLELFMVELDIRNIEVAELKDKLECAEKKYQQNECLKNNADAENRTLHRQNKELEAQLTSQKVMLDLLNEEKVQQKNENVSLQKTIQTLNGELQRQKLFYEELMIQITLQENALVIKSEEVEELSEQQEILKDKIQSLEGQHQHALCDEKVPEDVCQMNQRDKVELRLNKYLQKVTSTLEGVQNKKNLSCEDLSVVTGLKVEIATKMLKRRMSF